MCAREFCFAVLLDCEAHTAAALSCGRFCSSPMHCMFYSGSRDGKRISQPMGMRLRMMKGTAGKTAAQRSTLGLMRPWPWRLRLASTTRSPRRRRRRRRKRGTTSRARPTGAASRQARYRRPFLPMRMTMRSHRRVLRQCLPQRAAQAACDQQHPDSIRPTPNIQSTRSSIWRHCHSSPPTNRTPALWRMWAGRRCRRLLAQLLPTWGTTRGHPCLTSTHTSCRQWSRFLRLRRWRQRRRAPVV